MFIIVFDRSKDAEERTQSLSEIRKPGFRSPCIQISRSQMYIWKLARDRWDGTSCRLRARKTSIEGWTLPSWPRLEREGERAKEREKIGKNRIRLGRGRLTFLAPSLEGRGGHYQCISLLSLPEYYTGTWNKHKCTQCIGGLFTHSIFQKAIDKGARRGLAWSTFWPRGYLWLLSNVFSSAYLPKHCPRIRVLPGSSYTTDEHKWHILRDISH